MLKTPQIKGRIPKKEVFSLQFRIIFVPLQRAII